ncbi:MAG: 5'-nucleotidase C-terminal domain-containing protein [Actinobacteria bacterium]|nr:5'-nucleotidase C-terminal domain-containing protein [Actinomycetota bacterium]
MLLVSALVLGLSVLPAPGASAAGHVEIQILSVSDWHAQLDPLSVFGVGNVGGAAALSTYFQQERAANPNTLTFTAGDSYGASPPLSNFFDEEPAVRAMNLMGFTADTLGNHNFDRGIDHLNSMIALAQFPYVSANLKNVNANLSDVRGYRMFTVGGVKVAVVGITNPDAPELVFPGSFGTIEVTDPVEAANRARAAAKRKGAQIVIALAHMGVTGQDPGTGEYMGPLIDLAEGLKGFSLILGDHTDFQFAGKINGALVVENRSKGLTYARSTLTFRPATGKVVSKMVEFVTPFSDAVPPDPMIEQMLAPYRTALAEAFDEVIGVADDLFPRADNIERLGEVAIGNLITDSLLWKYGTQLAFTNGGGIRAPLPSSYLPQDTSLRRTSPGYAAGPPFDLVVGDVFTVLPFGNSVVTRTVTGAQLHEILEHSVSAIPGASGRFGQIAGFSFTYDPDAAVGSRVQSVTLDGGAPILPDATVYTFATNDFVNAGGDGYAMLADGMGTTRDVMADVLLEYIADQGVITPTIEGRITQV